MVDDFQYTKILKQTPLKLNVWSPPAILRTPYYSGLIPAITEINQKNTA